MLLTAVLAWCQCWLQWYHIDQNSHDTPHFDDLDLRNVIVLLKMPSLMAVSVASNENKIIMHLIYFDHLDVWNPMVPVLMPLAPCDVSANANGITWLKMSCFTSFWSSWANKAIVPLTIPSGSHAMPAPNVSHDQKVMLHLILMILTKQMQWCHWWCHWHYMMLKLIWMTWHKKVAGSISFWSSWTNTWNDAIDDTVGIMWHWYQHQWHHMTKNIMFHIVWTVLT